MTAASAPSRVLVVEPAATGGLHAHVRDELEALSALGVIAERADVDIRPRPDVRADLRTVRSLRHAAADGSCDAVHAHGLRAGALAGLALGTPRRRARRAGERPATRLVVTLHNRSVGSRAARATGALLLRVVARTADTVLAVSSDLIGDARRAGAPDVRLAVVPAHPPAVLAAPDDARARVRDGTPDGVLDVLVVARLAPQKGLGTLLDAAVLLARTAPGAVRIRVVGDGPLRADLAARIAAEGLDVRLLGRREDVPELLGGAGLVVSSAVWEGQPVALQEALHAGRAIVATDAGGTREVTGEAAHLVPVGDAGALAGAILALRDPARRRRAEQASRRRAGELPTREDMATQLRAVLVPERRPR